MVKKVVLMCSVLFTAIGISLGGGVDVQASNMNKDLQLTIKQEKIREMFTRIEKVAKATLTTQVKEKKVKNIAVVKAKKEEIAAKEQQKAADKKANTVISNEKANQNKAYGEKLNNPDLTQAERQQIIQEKKNYNQSNQSNQSNQVNGNEKANQNRAYGEKLSNPDLTQSERQQIIQEKKNYNQGNQSNQVNGNEKANQNRAYGEKLSNPDLTQSERQQIIQEKKNYNQNRQGGRR
ncbi:hypothetical protein [Brochothrix thermosphacta]|uniref:hypothetical protein n=1 Tax=Brochothrix thermosphacta TaxID=2756 RepID=UPI0039AF74DB